ncbi:MAG: ATP-binding protein [Rhodospirillales bacterium]|jgi:PAS domain S-box-containing protein
MMVKLFNELVEPTQPPGQAQPEPSRILPSLLLALSLFGAGIGGLAYFDHANRKNHLEGEAAAVRGKLLRLKSRLEGALDQRLFLSQGLEALVRSQPDISAGDFEHVARILLVGRNGVRSLILARNNVVSHIFPAENTRLALGSNLFSRPDQADAIKEAIYRQAMVLSGPFSLVQGGSALASRAPIFISGPEPATDYWGMVSVIIETDGLFDEAGFRSAHDREGVRVAVRGRDAKGAAGGMVWGEPSLFNEQPVSIEMDVPGGKWRLAAVPSAGWTQDYSDRLFFWTLGTVSVAALAIVSAIVSAAAGRISRQFQGRAAVKKELTESEERFRRLAEASWEGLVIHDWAHIYDFNMRLVEMTGYPPEEIRRMSILDLIEPEDREKLRQAQDDTFGAQHEIRIRCKDGHAIVAESRGADLFFRGRLLHVTSLRDITKTKEAEQALVTARDAAQMANRVKSEFLANMSHELRTPLNAVIGFSEIMEQELLGPLGAPRYKTYVHDIQVSAHHLLDIINDILDISRVEAGTMDLFETNFDPTVIARSSLRLLEARAAKGKCKLQLDLPSAPLPMVLADERRMKQILLNLLSNAVKFTPEGGRVCLRLALEEDGGLTFAVSDTGIGMSDDDIKKALTPFMQVDSGLNRRQEGTGLGLPLAKNMIEMHQAQMAVESAPGQGTTVSFKLPPKRLRTGSPTPRVANSL